MKSGHAAIFLALSVILTCCSPQDEGAVADTSAEAEPVSLPGEYRASRWQAREMTYRCAGDEYLQVSYLNILEDSGGALRDSFAVLYFAGKLNLMRLWEAASGARYLALDEQASYRWYSKGNEGFLAFLEADHTASEQVVLADCVAL